MSDDIVTRLQTKYGGQLPITIEAAEEIERLREELDRYKVTISSVIDALDFDIKGEVCGWSSGELTQILRNFLPDDYYHNDD